MNFRLQLWMGKPAPYLSGAPAAVNCESMVWSSEEIEEGRGA